MERFGSDPKQLERAAKDNLDDVFPESVIVVREPDSAKLAQLYLCGLAVADIINKENEALTATFVHADTVYTRALRTIFDLENEEWLAPGSHDRAVDTLMEGAQQFFDEWGSFLPGQE